MISESGVVYKEQDPGLAVIFESGVVFNEEGIQHWLRYLKVG